MDQRQKSQVGMFLTVQQVCEQYQTELNTIPAAQSAYIRLQSLIAKIQDAVQLQAVDSKGVTLDKNRSRADLTGKAFAIARALKALANQTEDGELLNQVNYARSTITGLSDFMLKEICDIILEAAIKYQTDLQFYGVDNPEIIELNDAVGVFAKRLNTPRVAIVNRKLATTQIKRLINEAAYLLREGLDLVMTQFEGTKFFDAYTSARIIIDPGVNPGGEDPAGPEADDDGTALLQ